MPFSAVRAIASVLGVKTQDMTRADKVEYSLTELKHHVIQKLAEMSQLERDAIMPTMLEAIDSGSVGLSVYHELGNIAFICAALERAGRTGYSVASMQAEDEQRQQAAKGIQAEEKARAEQKKRDRAAKKLKAARADEAAREARARVLAED